MGDRFRPAKTHNSRRPSRGDGSLTVSGRVLTPMSQSVDQEFESGPDFVEGSRLQRSVVETPVDPVRRSLNEREDDNRRE